MTLIQKCGGLGQAELIASLVLTTAILPQGYIPKLKAYFSVLDGHIFLYDEDHRQLLPFTGLNSFSAEIVILADLRNELKLVKGDAA